MTEIEVLDFDKKANKMVILLKNSNVAIANAIRRAIMDDVPVMAIEDVEFRKNSTALYDEMISLRLGLVALKTDLEGYNLPADCKCAGAGCARCQVKLNLTADEPGIVYAEGMKSKDPKTKPIFAKTPIVKLIKGQKIEFEATAILGTGREHAKWSPGIVHYKHYPIIKQTSDIKDPSLVQRFPGIFEEKNGKTVINEKNFVKSHLTDSVDELTGGVVKVEDSKDSFVLTIESWGQLECKEMLEQSLSRIEQKLESFTKEFGKK